jgi:putative membrane protein
VIGTTTAPRRASPLIVLLHTVTFRQARQYVPAVLAIGAARGLFSGPVAVAVLVAAVTLGSLLLALLSWWRFTYEDGPTVVVVTQGVLSRRVRTVPRDRIRSVDVEAPPLHRLLGLVKVRVDAAAGHVRRDEQELVIDGVAHAEGERLRLGLLAHPATETPTASAVPATPAEEEWVRFDHRWLLYAPLVGSYLAVPLAAVGALYRAATDLPGEDPLGRLLAAAAPARLSDVRVLAAAGAAAVVLLAVGAVAGAAVVNWRFRLVRRGGSLLAVRGLITRRHTELEVDRIRGGALTQGLGMRLVGAARATALVTGLADAAKRGQLLPLGPAARGRALVGRLVEDPGPLVAHPAAARRRRLVRSTAPGLALTLAGLVLTLTEGAWPVLVAGGGLALLGVPLGLGRYAALGHAAGPRSFAVRSGWLHREQAVLQRRAVVGWRVEQTFFQRRAALATVTACVGAGRGGYTAVDLGADDVAPFAIAASGDWARTLAP